MYVCVCVYICMYVCAVVVCRGVGGGCQAWEKTLHEQAREHASSYRLKLEKRTREADDAGARARAAEVAYREQLRATNISLSVRGRQSRPTRTRRHMRTCAGTHAGTQTHTRLAAGAMGCAAADAALWACTPPGSQAIHPSDTARARPSGPAV
jgi:hypothetical protein